MFPVSIIPLDCKEWKVIFCCSTDVNYEKLCCPLNNNRMSRCCLLPFFNCRRAINSVWLCNNLCMLLVFSQLHQQSSETANNSGLMHFTPLHSLQVTGSQTWCPRAATKLKHKVLSLRSYLVPSTAEVLATTWIGQTAFPPPPHPLRLPFFFFSSLQKSLKITETQIHYALQ